MAKGHAEVETRTDLAVVFFFREIWIFCLVLYQQGWTPYVDRRRGHNFEGEAACAVSALMSKLSQFAVRLADYIQRAKSGLSALTYDMSII